MTGVSGTVRWRGRARTCLLAVAAAGVLSGCSWLTDDEEILEGTRIPVRPEEAEAVVDSNTARSLMMPPMVDVVDWTHRNAVATHMMPHARVGNQLALQWQVSAGSGGLLTAPPVVAGGRAFVLDAEAEVHAFSTGGDDLWNISLAPEGEDGDEGWGGGLAVADGVLYASSGFGEVLAIDPASGDILWRSSVGAPVGSAPTVTGGRVVVVNREDQAFALNARTGDVLWRRQGALSVTGMLGGASPAVDNVVAVLPFTSGEVLATLASSGRQIWNVAVSGGRRGLVRAQIGDITSGPVIDGDSVYVGNQSGRLVSINRRTGERNWTANHGSMNAVQPAGDSVFVMSDIGQLLRLDAATGARIWGVDLGEFEDPEDQDDVIGYGGPILAGGRVMVVNTTGELLGFDPMTGAETDRIEMPDGSYLTPAISGDTIYVVGTDGSLMAFR